MLHFTHLIHTFQTGCYYMLYRMSGSNISAPRSEITIPQPPAMGGEIVHLKDENAIFGMQG